MTKKCGDMNAEQSHLLSDLVTHRSRKNMIVLRDAGICPKCALAALVTANVSLAREETSLSVEDIIHVVIISLASACDLAIAVEVVDDPTMAVIKDVDAVLARIIKNQ